MKLWIVTIGSSDVQLDSDKTNKEKGRTEEQRSDKVWRNWYDDDIKADYHDVPCDPQPAFKDKEECYRIPPRILGIVYDSSREEVKQEIQSYLTFPLLDNFVEKLNNLGVPDAIAILLTDQSNFFKQDKELEKIKSPYWQDTCELQPILENYFRDKFPNSELIPLQLSPQGEEGLDDWDSVLDIVRNELYKIKLKPDTVYVSHQAGTPAISSAVQFESLAQFGQRVKFLVSNEYNQKTRAVSRSKYLRSLQLQEAKALLKRHDYSGVKLLVSDHVNSDINILLDAAIQWNYAKFDNFKTGIQDFSDRALVQQVNERSQHWWWTAYEAAYLAVVRLKQENIVEAMFHSFRAVEGLILEWAVWKYKPQIKKSNPKQLRTQYFHKENIEMSNQLNYWFEKYANKTYSSVGLFGEALLELLKASYHPGKWNQNDDLKTVTNITINERNFTFHKLRGLQQSDLFDAWGTQDREDWQNRLLSCLNFIAQDDLPKDMNGLPQPFTSLEKASVMARLHEELEKAIAQY